MSDEERNPNLEYPDPRPVEWPLNLRKPPSIQEMIRQYVRTELSRQAVEEGAESFDDFHDFDVEEEDGEFVTQHELAAMSPEEAGFDPDAEVIDGRKSVQEADGGAARVAAQGAADRGREGRNNPGPSAVKDGSGPGSNGAQGSGAGSVG